MAPGLIIDDCSNELNTASIPPYFQPSKTLSSKNGTHLTAYEQLDTSLTPSIQGLSKIYTNPSLLLTPSSDNSSFSLSLSNTQVPTPTAHQALIHIRCTGICGSDLHLWRHGRIGPLQVTRPCILGHESSGMVIAIGSAVTNLRPGDRVAIEPGVPCGNCWLCKQGRYNLCEEVKFCGIGTEGCDGGIRRFACHDARFCHVMPETMSWRQGALLEPLAVVMHAIRECEGLVALGRPALVCGAGPIGLIALKALRASGSWPLAVTDVDEQRLEFARRSVPGIKTWRVDGGKSEVENAEGVRNLFDCCGNRDVERGVPDENEYVAPQVVLECTGVESSVATAAYAVRRGGMVMVVGVGKSKMNNLPFMHLSLSEIQLRFINRYRDLWPAAMNLLAEGAVMDLDELVTHEFVLEDAVQAMETCADRSKGSVKVHVVDNADVQI